MVLPAVPAAGAEKILHTFQGGSDGIAPWGVLIRDKTGNLYGTTAGGGGGMGCNDGSDGCGIVFRIAPDATEAVLHAFAGGCDGAFPFSGLVADKTGNFYGTTVSGGTCNSDQGDGTVYKLAPDGTETVVYAFMGGSDGYGPNGLTADEKGNLYGMTSAGGNGPGCNNIGCGLVFEITPKGKETVLYNFQGGSDGAEPYGNVIRDAVGNLFGTTADGGSSGCGGGGCGTVFKLAPDGTETILYAFQGGSDGEFPQNGVVADSAGNLYGTTAGGGGELVGTIFEVTPAGIESVLYSFARESGGYYPEAGLIFDKAGNLYSTTSYGGGAGCKASGGCGAAFMLAPDGSETVLYGFKGHRGREPSAGLLLGKHGDLYGTTNEGGDENNGVVFELKE
ncbi:MAG TPA: choice-of-anchor tandem repeat GloVer-containing protein [Rhizomicrobium sp.]|nr:choice-of-anchor tandem repeat GloVer-containing protein [Rhizomicrobium sp.]